MNNDEFNTVPLSSVPLGPWSKSDEEFQQWLEDYGEDMPDAVYGFGDMP